MTTFTVYDAANFKVWDGQAAYADICDGQLVLMDEGKDIVAGFACGVWAKFERGMGQTNRP